MKILWARLISGILLMAMIIVLKHFRLPVMFSGLALCCAVCCIACSVQPGDGFINIEQQEEHDL
jgi:hypothetical protein